MADRETRHDRFGREPYPLLEGRSIAGVEAAQQAARFVRARARPITEVAASSSDDGALIGAQ